MRIPKPIWMKYNMVGEEKAHMTRPPTMQAVEMQPTWRMIRIMRTFTNAFM